MTASSRMVARVEIRRTPLSYLSIALLLGFAGAVVLGAAAGAYRTSTAVDRFIEESDQGVSVWVQNDTDLERVWESVRSVPGVRTVAPFTATIADVGTDFDFFVLSSAEPAAFTEFAKPRVLEGRLPRGGNEVVMNESAAEQTGVDVPGIVRAPTLTPEEAACFAGGEDCEGQGAWTGPELELHVVGIVRMPTDVNSDRSSASPMAITTPEFWDEYSSPVGTQEGMGAVQPQPGVNPVDLAAAIRAALPDDAIAAVEPFSDQVHSATDDGVQVMVVSILVFAIVGALGSALVLGQTITRQVLAAAPSAALLSALGATRRDRIRALVLALVPSVTAGTVLALVGAVLASPIFPLGIAELAEPDPGLAFDARILLCGAVVVWTLAMGWALVSARLTVRAGTVARVRGKTTSEVLSRAAVPVVPATGARYALERPPTRALLPGWVSVALAAFAFAGVFGATAYGASADRLHDDPDRWGHTWDLGPIAFWGSPEEANAAVEALAERPVTAAASYTNSRVEIGGEQLYASSLDPRFGDIPFTRIEGRLPTSASEVALGTQTLSGLGLDIGDTVSSRKGGDLRVVGRVVVPVFDDNEMGEGAVLTAPGLEDHRVSEPESYYVVDGAPGVETEDLISIVGEEGFGAGVYALATPPSAVTDLDEARTVPLALAAFFAVLGFASLAHAMSVTARRRRQELGVLRVLGLRSGQARAVAQWQATVVVAAGAVIGIPLGLFVGSWVWERVATAIGVASDVALSPRWMLLATVGALVSGLVLGTVSGRVATRATPATLLREE